MSFPTVTIQSSQNFFLFAFPKVTLTEGVSVWLCECLWDGNGQCAPSVPNLFFSSNLFCVFCQRGWLDASGHMCSNTHAQGAQVSDCVPVIQVGGREVRVGERKHKTDPEKRNSEKAGGKTPLYLFNLICSLWNLLSWLWFIVNRWAAALFKNGC